MDRAEMSRGREEQRDQQTEASHVTRTDAWEPQATGSHPEESESSVTLGGTGQLCEPGQV